jgi:hypothetical protein
VTARILRAFVWLRWRVLVNAFERTGSRDMLERFSVAIDNLGPIMALVLLVPSSIGLGIVGGIGGFGLATGSWLVPFQIVRFFLLAACGFAVFGPIVLPARDTANPVRLLLLPIPRRILFIAQLTATLADPWIFLVIPPMIGVPIGLAIGGRPVAAAAALVAGALLLALLAALTSLTGSAVNLLLRDRRRADIVMLVLVLGLPMIGLVPSIVAPRSNRHGHQVPGEARVSAADRFVLRAAGYVPSEIYQRTVTAASQRNRRAVPGLALLAVAAAFVQIIAFAAFGRVLDMPQTLGVRRAGTVGGGFWGRRLPGLSPASSAVALAHVRLVTRTPRGLAIMAAPLIMFAFFGLGLFRGHESLVGIPLHSGVMLAALVLFLSITAALPIAVNQFAIEGAGFTRHLLLPLTIRELLFGKAAGTLLVTLPAALICFVAAAALFPDGSLALWASIPPAYVATYALTAPVNAALSAVFPKVVDLSRIGKGSNPHQGASLLGLATILASAALPAIFLLLGVFWLERPGLAFALELGWCAVAVAIAWLLFTPVARLVLRRCDTLVHYH